MEKTITINYNEYFSLIEENKILKTNALDMEHRMSDISDNVLKLKKIIRNEDIKKTFIKDCETFEKNYVETQIQINNVIDMLNTINSKEIY